MNKLLSRSLLALAAVGLAYTTFGSTDALAVPGCSSAGEPRGTVCWMGGNPPKVVTSCGGTKYIDGAVTNAGTLDDRCFAAYGRPKGGEKLPAKDEVK